MRDKGKFLLTVCCLLTLSGVAHSQPRPNLLFGMSDDHGNWIPSLTVRPMCARRICNNSRAIEGGIFIKMLEDKACWMRWAGK